MLRKALRWAVIPGLLLSATLTPVLAEDEDMIGISAGDLSSGLVEEAVRDLEPGDAMRISTVGWEEGTDPGTRIDRDRDNR